MISPLLTTDDAVWCRTTASRWNVGCRHGELGETFFLASQVVTVKTREVSQLQRQVSASATTATMRLESTVVGGSTTHFLADMMKINKKEERRL